mmetsp:Transcript_40257/g.72525  ORF Transcript_40257/g.72525 Transcript_40257/m.72525 type:complete len:91 (-) Transcript_40257:357-629(-)
MKSIGQSRSRRLINDPLHIQTRNPPGILGGLPLLIVKMGGNRNHRCFYGFAQMFFCCHLQFGENHGADFLGAQFLLLSAPLDNNLRLSVS